MKKNTYLYLVTLVAAFACSENRFQTDLRSKQLPWTAAPQEAEKDQFTFAIIGDLNGGERERVFEIAAQQISLLKPQFTLSIGDLIDGGSEDTTVLKIQFDDFDSRVAKMGVPFFHLVGNHDITNTVMREYWEKRYGARYYYFIFNNVLFLMVDSEDYDEKRMMEIYFARKRAIELLDSGKTEIAHQGEYFRMPERITGNVSNTQSAYFENAIKQNPNVRWTFLFMHKPIWQKTGEGSLEKIEAALKDRNYTLFNGHLHEYSYTKRHERDYIMVGTTGGSQNPALKNAFDHISVVTMSNAGPSILNLRLDGMLDKTGMIPLNGDTICFQASRCGDPKASGH